MSSKRKNQLRKGFKKADLGPIRPPKKCVKIEKRIRMLGSQKTLKERPELQYSFMKRIARP